MKKLTLVTLAFVGLVLATSCKKDPVAPILTLTTEPNITEGAEVEAGTCIKFSFDCQGENLSTLLVTVTDENGEEKDHASYSLDGASSATKTRECVFTHAGRLTLEATLTGNGKTANVTLHFTSVAPIEPEPEPNPTTEGHYRGTVGLTATAAAMGVSYPVETQLPWEIRLSEAEEEGKVNATVTYEEQVYTTTGTIDDGSIIFEPFDIKLDLSGSTATVTLDMTCRIGEGVLAVQGTFAGSGSVVMPDVLFPIPATIEGSLEGDLDKVD